MVCECRADTDSYLSTRGPASLLGGLKQQRCWRIMRRWTWATLTTSRSSTHALIFYCGIAARARPHLLWSLTHLNKLCASW